MLPGVSSAVKLLQVYVHLVGLLFWVTDSMAWTKELFAQDLAAYTWKIHLWWCPGSRASAEQPEADNTAQILRKQYSS